ncbi:MAG: dUTP diphosphatase [Oscillospiraceae bacterium]
MMKIKKLYSNSIVPKRATQYSAGLDLFAHIDQPIEIATGEIAKIPTGIAIEIENGTAGFVFGRSGLGIKNGISPANAVGVIDSDYRGEIIVGLINNSNEKYTIEPDDRIAQLIVMKIELPEIVECDELCETSRGEGGLGSTGKK